MRIIEIGDSAGSVTRSVLKRLKSPENVRLYSAYTFTDASADNVEAARKAFAEEDIDFKLLVIEKDLGEQGFEKHSFDFVIASNVGSCCPLARSSGNGVTKLIISRFSEAEGASWRHRSGIFGSCWRHVVD
jgi:phospholipid N-methyltransferase